MMEYTKNRMQAEEKRALLSSLQDALPGCRCDGFGVPERLVLTFPHNGQMYTARIRLKETEVQKTLCSEQLYNLNNAIFETRLKQARRRKD